MKKSLKKLGLAGMLFGATALGIGCASFYEDPMFRALYGTPQELLPEFIQSGGYREYKRNEAREEAEKKRIEREKEIRAHMLQAKENNYQNQRQEKSRYERYQELPLIFLCSKYDSKKDNPDSYIGVGTKIITPEQKKYQIVGKAEIFDRGKEVTNITECLTLGEKGEPFKKILEEGEYGDFVAGFSSEVRFKIARERGYSKTLWKNTWYVDGKEVGSVTYTLVDTEMMEKQSLTKRNERKSPREEIQRNKKFTSY
jgi:hypothetical protein